MAATSLITAARLEPLTSECNELIAILTVSLKRRKKERRTYAEMILFFTLLPF